MLHLRRAVIATVFLSLALVSGEASKQPISADTQVYITKSGKKYHTAGCRYLSKSGIKISLSEAKKNYQPCSVCNPDK